MAGSHPVDAIVINDGLKGSHVNGLEVADEGGDVQEGEEPQEAMLKPVDLYHGVDFQEQIVRGRVAGTTEESVNLGITRAQQTVQLGRMEEGLEIGVVQSQTMSPIPFSSPGAKVRRRQVRRVSGWGRLVTVGL